MKAIFSFEHFRFSIHLLTSFSLLFFIACDTSDTINTEPTTVSTPDKEIRSLNQITLTEEGYELGLQHGKKLKSEIGEIVTKWKENTTRALERDADSVLIEFMAYSNFEEAIKKWTPDLFEEVKGIADGSDQDFNHIFVLNLLDEFWVYIDDLENHHCSDVGIPAHNGRPTVVAQNMDIEGYTDGYQTVFRKKRTGNNPEQLIMSHPGLIALNGLNENGIGVVVNTIMQLRASNEGLPVAFVVRKLLSMTNKEDILEFITTVPHASGQSYIIGIGDEVYNFEASAGKVTPHDPGNENGTVYHTNHPIVNENLKPWHAEYDPAVDPETLPVNSNSYIRLSSVSSRINSNKDITIEDVKSTLRSKDDPENPVCRSWDPDKGFTFASTIMQLGEKPTLIITAGPPDESAYKTIPIN